MSAATPPISDRLDTAIRAFAVPQAEGGSRNGGGRPDREPLGASGWVLIFDTETTTDPGQSLRFGTYQFRNAEELDEAGVFYDPEGVTESELATISAYAARNGLVLRDRDSFIDNVFFDRAYDLRATIVGFNLPFDISRLAIKHGSARTPVDADTAAMRGGFTFTLSRQKFRPNIRIKHMSRRAALISFAAPMRQRSSRGQRKRHMLTPARRGHFIDLKTVAAALFARGFSLARLCKFLKIENPKLEFEEFDGPITDEMLRYAVGDVQATWECYRELISQFGQHQLTRTIPEKLYSEASIGKGYLREMGIMPWRKAQPDFPPQLTAIIMSTFFGGRSEVGIRREVRQVLLCDFLSMYPTVCTLMGLWRFVIASGMTWRDNTAEIDALLEHVDLATLQDRDAWRNLATLVRVQPGGDIFPVRADYGGNGQTTIGANHLTSDQPLWFTLADCIAAKLLTGKPPAILEAITFEPGSVQPCLRSINIAGNPDYIVDPAETDLFKRVIELRQSVKSGMKHASDELLERLDVEQNALKILANSTSYGIWAEVNVERRDKRRAISVHHSIGEPFVFDTDLAEMPGSYFHPLLAALITGAARLMLAITERLIVDQGLEWAFCDTDSMAIAKPEDMSGEEFMIRAKSVAEWFGPLNPYRFGGSIFKIEGENSSLTTGEPEALYCFAVSAKRYALFNLASDGQPILRKVSAHGLGHMIAPYRECDATSAIPAPHPSVLRNGVERWHCDLWHNIIGAGLAGDPDRVRLDYHPALTLPVVSHYGATTPELLRWLKSWNDDRAYRQQVKPFGFMSALKAAIDFGVETIAASRKRGRPRKTISVRPIAPFTRDHAKVVEMAFDRMTSAPVPASTLETYAATLTRYHLHPEAKFLKGDYFDRGSTHRRHVQVTNVRLIGKESNDWERQAVLGLEIMLNPTYAAKAR